MLFDRIAERRIRQAMDDGEFDNLPNVGRRLDLEEYFKWPEEMRSAYALLKSANCAPFEVELLRDIARLEAACAAAPNEAARQSIAQQLAARRGELAVRLEHARRQR